MADTYTEVKHVGCFSRLMDSIKNLVGAVLLVLISVAVIFGNESCSERQADNLAAGAAAVVEAEANTVNPANEGKLVHVTGTAATTENLVDPQFGVSVNALKLERTVEMYQWKESSSTTEEKNVGGSVDQKTTYTYAQVWEKSLISSAGFKEPTGHTNPTAMPYQAMTVLAKQATLGAFTLTETLLSKATVMTGVPNLPQPPVSNAKISGNGYYIGANPTMPQVGDMRVTFQMVAPQPVSVIAQQVGSSFGEFNTGSGGIEMLECGTKTAAQMFAAAAQANTAMRWGLRFLGWLLLFAGIAILFQPLVVVADVIPLIGSLLQRGVTLISLIIATPLAIVLIIVAKLVAKIFA